MLSNDNDHEYEEESVDDVEDPRPVSNSRRSNHTMSESTTEAPLGSSSVQQSFVSRDTSPPRYNTSRRSDAPLLASNQIRSSMQQTNPLSQSELIARSMQQNRQPSQSVSRGPQASTRSSVGAGQAAPPANSVQNVSSTNYVSSRQGSMGSIGQQHQPMPQNMASRQANMGSVGKPLGADGNMSRSSPQVASSRSAYASQRKDGVDPGTSRMRHWVIVFGLLILICLAVAAIVLPLYVKPQYKDTSLSPDLSTDAPGTTSSAPTLSPSSKVQSMQPTTEKFSNFVKDFALELSGPSVLEDSTSPQYKAVEFIANDANYTSTITDDAMLGEFYAIAVFYYSTGGDYWLECSKGSDSCPGGVSWMTYNVSYCDWNWISCNEAGRVDEIIFSDVQGNNLTGTLTSELALLTELQQFAVVNDNIEGSLPKELGDLTQVTHFILSNNSISGKIPRDFLENSPLEVFMVSDNKFKGEIPKSLTKKSTIYQIFLDNNRFSGTISEKFGSLPNLSTLDLTENQLTGEIPDEIYSDSIQNLYLGGSTKIQGTLSSAVGQATNLVRLHITGTRISGGIPDELFTLPVLTELILSDNTLTGELSDSVAGLGGTLRVLMLDGNKFSGDLPNVAIDDLTISNTLKFDKNSFTGAISPTTCRRKGDGRNDLQIITVDCNEVTCSCCNNCGE